MTNRLQRFVKFNQYESYFFLILLIFFLSMPSSLLAAETTIPKTPADAEGPFYPVARQNDEDNDLLHVNGQVDAAKGTTLNLSGVVISTHGTPLPGLIVEIWQTDTKGRYMHPDDRSTGKRDPNFQYWGKATTNKGGTFNFTTLLPGAYHPRPAHIHFKVWQDTTLLLTSQMYFHTPEQEQVPTSSRISLLTTELEQISPGSYKAFFRIIL